MHPLRENVCALCMRVRRDVPRGPRSGSRGALYSVSMACSLTGCLSPVAQRFAGGQSFIIAGIVKGVTAGFKTNEEADEIEAFFRTNPIPSAQRAVAQSIEGIRGKAKFIQIAKVRGTLTVWCCKPFDRLTPPSPLSFSSPATLLSGCPYPRPPLSWKHPQRLTYVTYVSCAGTPHANQCDHI